MKSLITITSLALAGLLVTSCEKPDVDPETSEAVEAASESVKEAASDVAEAVTEATPNAAQAVKDVTHAAEKAAGEAKELAVDAIDAVKEVAQKPAVQEKIEEVKEAVTATQEAVEEKVTEVKTDLAEKVADSAEAVAEKAEEVSKPKPAEAEAAAAEAPATETADTSMSGEWPQWGHNGSNNMYSPAKNIPLDITAGEIDSEGHVTDAKNAKWVVKLGSQAYGTPTIQGGRILVGTNNEEPRLDSIKGDRGIVLCLDEESGELNWQFSVPKLGAGKVSDWEFLGICSSVLIDGKHGYVVTNRGEIICLDLYGMSDGNDGPFQTEGKYMVGGLEKMDESEPVEVGDKDADIVWGYDMRSELGAFPHNITSSSVVLSGDNVFCSTSNGVDWSHINIPAPSAPSFIALDKKTGELSAEEASGISERVMHCNWSSPAAGVINGKDTVVFGAGDGWAYGYAANEFDTEEDGGETFNLMKELWKVDCCPKEYRFNDAGEPIKYATYPGPSEIISSPVIANNKVYICIGQDPEHGEGVGCVTCIDPTKGTEEDAIVWQFKGVGRTISTPSIADGLLYIADYSGRLYCLDAETGEQLWDHDTFSHIWGSTLVVDGKVFLGNEDGELVVLKHGREKEELATISYPAPIYSTCVVANNTLYVMTQTHLYAYKQ
ncbi:MAG: PQQ-binding-like beta-propeller repeat protein [Verrucomicrobiales bacterium]|nr:PQQ-binding-like beta-propeller repeat protein [Verrucomicrobiales bacterium]